MKILPLFLIAGAFLACGNADQSTERSQTNSTEQAVQTQVKPIDQAAFQQKMQEEGVVVIDVRTAGEVSQGYIKGADDFIDINSSDFESKIKALDHDKTYLMYCRSGARSGRAAQFMVDNGFSDVYNLTGGIINYKGEITQ